MSEEGRRRAAARWRAIRVNTEPEYTVVEDEIRDGLSFGLYLTDMARQGWRVAAFQTTDNGYCALLERKVLPE